MTTSARNQTPSARTAPSPSPRRVAGSWIRRFAPAEDAAVQLVCLPHAGGAATAFVPAARALAPEIDVLAVQYPGRQDRFPEPVIEDIADLADAVAAELRPWCDRPLALFGHSMGAVVGYEVARRLENAGLGPLGLFASGRRAPSTVRERTEHWRDDRALIESMRQMAGTGDEVLADESLLPMVLKGVRGDYKAVETYQPDYGPPLACPIQVLSGSGDTQTSPEENRAWERHTTADCRLQEFSGGHFFVFDDLPSVLDVVRPRLREWMAARARRDSGA